MTALSCSKYGCIRLSYCLTCSSGNHAAGLVHSLTLPLIQHTCMQKKDVCQIVATCNYLSKASIRNDRIQISHGCSNVPWLSSLRSLICLLQSHRVEHGGKREILFIVQHQVCIPRRLLFRWCVQAILRDHLQDDCLAANAHQNAGLSQAAEHCKCRQCLSVHFLQDSRQMLTCLPLKHLQECCLDPSPQRKSTDQPQTPGQHCPGQHKALQVGSRESTAATATSSIYLLSSVYTGGEKPVGCMLGS